MPEPTNSASTPASPTPAPAPSASGTLHSTPDFVAALQKTVSNMGQSVPAKEGTLAAGKQIAEHLQARQEMAKHAVVKDMSPQQLAGFSPHELQLVSAHQMAHLTPQHILALSDKQLGALTKDQHAAMGADLSSFAEHVRLTKYDKPLEKNLATDMAEGLIAGGVGGLGKGAVEAAVGQTGKSLSLAVAQKIVGAEVTGTGAGIGAMVKGAVFEGKAMAEVTVDAGKGVVQKQIPHQADAIMKHIATSAAKGAKDGALKPVKDAAKDHLSDQLGPFKDVPGQVKHQIKEAVKTEFGSGKTEATTGKTDTPGTGVTLDPGAKPSSEVALDPHQYVPTAHGSPAAGHSGGQSADKVHKPGKDGLVHIDHHGGTAHQAPDLGR